MWQMQYCLKVGNKYKKEHVYRLAKMVGDLTVITDDFDLANDFNIIEARYDGVWNKMIFFNEAEFPRGIFFDLDIDVLKPIKNVFQPSEYMRIAYTDWEDLDLLKQRTIGNPYLYCSLNSSVMVWNEKTKRQKVWEKFIQEKEKAMRLFNGIDTYLEHRHSNYIDVFSKGLVNSYRCNPNADVYIMSYDGEGKSCLPKP